VLDPFQQLKILPLLLPFGRFPSIIEQLPAAAAEATISEKSQMVWSQPLCLLLPTAFPSFDRHIGARSIDMWTRWCHTLTHTHTHCTIFSSPNSSPVPFGPFVRPFVRHMPTKRVMHTRTHSCVSYKVVTCFFFFI